MGLIAQAQQEPIQSENIVTVDPNTGEAVSNPDDPKGTGVLDQPGMTMDPPEDGPSQLPTTGPGDQMMTTTQPPATPTTTDTTDTTGAIDTVDTFSQMQTDPGAATGDTQFDTVSGQAAMLNQGLLDILNQDNPLFQQAEARARRAANARGLGSTSFSERAAQGALYDIALPMAQQASQQAQAYQQLTRQQDFASRQSALDRALQETMQGRDIEYRQWLQNTTREHETLITRNQQAMDAYTTFQQAAMEILSNPETTSEQKEAGMAALREGLTASLNMLSGLTNTDLSAYLPAGYGGGVMPGGPTTGPGPGGVSATSPADLRVPSSPQDINQWLQSATTMSGIPITDLGQFNTSGGLQSGDPSSWNWNSLMTDTMAGAASFVGDVLFDNVMVDAFNDAFPGVMEDDGIWSNLLGLGINLAATPFQMVFNLVGSIYDFFTGGGEGEGEGEGEASATGTSGGGTRNFSTNVYWEQAGGYSNPNNPWPPPGFLGTFDEWQRMQQAGQF